MTATGGRRCYGGRQAPTATRILKDMLTLQSSRHGAVVITSFLSLSLQGVAGEITLPQGRSEDSRDETGHAVPQGGQL